MSKKQRVSMVEPTINQGAMTQKPTGVLVLASGEVFFGHGAGKAGDAHGEVCFNTAMTGYQEILTDPSYAEQIILFTFPHIGNTGTNSQDEEAVCPQAHQAARGAIFREAITAPSNYRAQTHLNDWLVKRSIIGLSGIDTRALTSHIRKNGMQNGVIAHAPDGVFDIAALSKKARAWNGLEGADLAKQVGTKESFTWDETRWDWAQGSGDIGTEGYNKLEKAAHHVVVIDYGTKRNILRCLAEVGLRLTVVPADMAAADILAYNPDGIVLSNGPGDPAATGKYAIPIIRELIESELPVLGICLGHQILALALGAKTIKMAQGHHGANHPVTDLNTGKVEIVSMNHGFAVDADSLPDDVEQTHKSLFDGSNCGLRLKNRPVFSVQHHPEASPGPKDSFYLFERFAAQL